MRSSLVELLACPACGGDLTLHATRTIGDRVESGTVSCGAGHSYPIRDFVPVFAVEHDYVKVFSFLRQGDIVEPVSWNISDETRREFCTQTLIDPEELRGKTVLDAGCGGGRFVELLARAGARVVGADIDATGLGLTSRKLAHSENVHLVQADLFHPPFKPRAFDFVYSLGVLHHTPAPEAAFVKLTPLVKPGGRIAVWVYPKREHTPVSDFFRPLTTRMPKRALYWLALAVTSAYAPLLKIPRFNTRFQAWLYSARLPWHDQSYWRVQSFLDWYGPPYQFKYSPEELEQWFTAAGLIQVRRGTFETAAQGTVRT